VPTTTHDLRPGLGTSKYPVRDPMSDGTNDGHPTFRMVLQSREAKRYGFIFGRRGWEEWAQPSFETFASLEEADAAGCRAMEMAARRI
jgi:hypothetical protein